MDEKEFKTPISEKDVRSMKAGETVYITGTIFTARDQAHKKGISDKPLELNGAVIFHCGPLVKKTASGWEVVSAGPTTSSRMNALQPEFIKTFGTRVIIGKGGMDGKVLEALKAQGCVYLAMTGGCGALAAARIKRVKSVKWLEEFGEPEALWEFEVEKFGPLIVAMDANGNSLYKNPE